MTGHGLATLAALGWICLLGVPGIVLLERDFRHSVPALAAALLLGLALHLLLAALISLVMPISLPALMILSLLLSGAALLWRGRDLITPAISTVPFSVWPIVGASGAALWLALIYTTVGNDYGEVVKYTAYFNADGFKHMAYSWSAYNLGLPVVDPFGGGDTLPYYWLFYLLPGEVHHLVQGATDGEILTTLFGVSLVVAYLLLVTLYAILREIGTSAPIAAGLTFLAFLSPSLDGFAHLAAHQGEAFELAEYVDMDGYNLFLGILGHSVSSSTLFRMMLFGWQHCLAMALLAAWFYFAIKPTLMGRFVVARHILVLPIIATSTLVGLAALPAYLLCEWAFYWRDRTSIRSYAGSLFIFVAAVILPVALGMIGGDVGQHASTSLSSIENDAAGVNWAALFLAPLGPVADFSPAIFWAIAGGILAWSAKITPNRAHLAAWIVSGVALLMLVFADGFVQNDFIRVEAQLKISFVAAFGLWPAAALAFQERLSFRHGKLAGKVLLVLGLLTPLFNSVFFTTQHEYATIDIPNIDQRAFVWIRENTPSDALFLSQTETGILRGGRDTWVPIFAGRNVAMSYRAGHGITILGTSVTLEQAFVDGDGHSIEQFASQENVRYLYFSRSLHKNSYDALRGHFKATNAWADVYDKNGVTIIHQK